jgi:tetratricopeptide (TPR) repeat protein
MLLRTGVGMYFGSSRIPPGALEGTFTAREYCRAMGKVGRKFIDGHSNDSRGAWRGQCLTAFPPFAAGDVSSALARLDRLLEQQPENRRVHRLIALVYLSRGRLAEAAKHLDLARRLLRRERASPHSLEHALYLHLEGAFLQYTLLSLYGRLDRPQDARALVEEERLNL